MPQFRLGAEACQYSHRCRIVIAFAGRRRLLRFDLLELKVLYLRPYCNPCRLLCANEVLLFLEIRRPPITAT